MTPDPFYEAMRKFLRGEVTWKEMKQVNCESLAAWNQRRAVRCAVGSALSTPEIYPPVEDRIPSA